MITAQTTQSQCLHWAISFAGISANDTIDCVEKLLFSDLSVALLSTVCCTIGALMCFLLSGYTLACQARQQCTNRLGDSLCLSTSDTTHTLSHVEDLPRLQTNCSSSMPISVKSLLLLATLSALVAHGVHARLFGVNQKPPTLECVTILRTLRKHCCILVAVVTKQSERWHARRKSSTPGTGTWVEYLSWEPRAML